MTQQIPPPSADKAVVAQAFVTPVARMHYPRAEQVNEALSEVILGRLNEVGNKFQYKSETPADMANWGEPLIDGLTRWVRAMAKKFVEAVAGESLDEVYERARLADQSSFNGGEDPSGSGSVAVASGRSWASVYRTGDTHPPHHHPNTAISAIYYVESPSTCDLDLYDPRPNIDYFDPGLYFAGEGATLRLTCQPGELLLFPGWLKHGVPPFGGGGLRMSLSWNLGYELQRPRSNS